MKKKERRRRGNKIGKKVLKAKTKLPLVQVEDSHQTDRITAKKKVGAENEIILPSSWSGENTDMYTSVEISDITAGTSGINLTIEDSMSPTSSTIGKLSIYQERKKEERNIHAYGISQIYEEVRKLDEIQMHFEQKRRALGDRFDSRVKGLPTWHRMQVLKLLKEACIQIKAVYEQEEQLLTE